MQNWFSNWKSINVIHHINRIKTKNIWSSQDTERAFDKNPVPFHDKTAQQTNRRLLPQPDEEYLQKTHN